MRKKGEVAHVYARKWYCRYTPGNEPRVGPKRGLDVLEKEEVSCRSQPYYYTD